ncbi:HAD hydrolase-like protein [Streptomyces sp. NRRL S-244]|uniref:HAD hydrolase-like protein n=1 Tax=Streptomyces sp. NRRL S-244 TaxID=1463897 RepID=UPI002D21B5DE|nr:HAD hydrolase-like protein [Streptomyces sp. NRRL S-244]
MQKRAEAKHATVVTRSNTVIIGDSLKDLRTGIEGGASAFGVASGKATAAALTQASSDLSRSPWRRSTSRPPQTCR